ncbi:sensor domain-containing protein [Nocardia mangyaensis]|uniref:sensor domain-containing protein n=1 Tax=Nocardia mangyaensis TaxID=2213200 RepID=UPI002674D9FE|nr:sensor domain-containing protein [Nocardia mangyaensis]MDO3649025.1 sensor domain-containing protein [Nocardia mangyaensis]
MAQTRAGRAGDTGRARGLVRRCCAAAAIVSVAVLTGCGQAVSGTPVAESAMSVRTVAGALADLLPTPQQFPDRYPAVVLPPQAASAAAGDLDGVGVGATVSPAACAPPEAEIGAEPAAVAVGSDDANRSTLTVELARSTEVLSSLRERLRGCERIRVARAGADSTVTTVLDEVVPPGADDAISLRRTVIPDVGGAGLTQTMQTSVGQIGDVRITVTSMTFGGGEPDTAAVAAMFETTVRAVHDS